MTKKAWSEKISFRLMNKSFNDFLLLNVDGEVCVSASVNVIFRPFSKKEKKKSEKLLLLSEKREKG